MDNNDFVAWAKSLPALPARINDIQEQSWRNFVKEAKWRKNR